MGRFKTDGERAMKAMKKNQKPKPTNRKLVREWLAKSKLIKALSPTPKPKPLYTSEMPNTALTLPE